MYVYAIDSDMHAVGQRIFKFYLLLFFSFLFFSFLFFSFFLSFSLSLSLSFFNHAHVLQQHACRAIYGIRTQNQTRACAKPSSKICACARVRARVRACTCRSNEPRTIGGSAYGCARSPATRAQSHIYMYGFSRAHPTARSRPRARAKAICIHTHTHIYIYIIYVRVRGCEWVWRRRVCAGGCLWVRVESTVKAHIYMDIVRERAPSGCVRTDSRVATGMHAARVREGANSHTGRSHLRLAPQIAPY